MGDKMNKTHPSTWKRRQPTSHSPPCRLVVGTIGQMEPKKITSFWLG